MGMTVMSVKLHVKKISEVGRMSKSLGAGWIGHLQFNSGVEGFRMTLPPGHPPAGFLCPEECPDG